MKIFGYLRFSYLGRSDVRLAQLSGQSKTAYRDKLFDGARMATRFHYFENLCLPSLQAQSDPDFTLVILASHSMPPEYKTRLKAAVAAIPQIIVHYADAPHVTDALTPIIQQLSGDLTEKSVHFRLDDDDALAAGFIANLRRIARHLYAGTVISMPRGFHLFSHGGSAYLTPKQENYIAIGWARIHKPGDFRNPFAFAHSQIAQRVPSYLNPRRVSYIHTLHPHSDTMHHHARTLPRLIRENPDIETAAVQNKIDAQLAENFPWVTRSRLLQISASAPGQSSA